MLRKAGNFLRYLFGILMMLAGAGYWKEEKAYALSLLLLGIFLLPVTWNTIKKRFHVAKALPVLLPVLLLVSACALTPVTYSSKETQKASAESVSVSVTAAPTKKATPTPTETSTPTPTARSEEHTSELQSLFSIPYAVFCLKNLSVNSENSLAVLII